MPVDLYVGGVEHAVLHLLYARFWHKVLYDSGFVSTPEPFQKLRNQGLVVARSYQHANGAYVPPEEVKEENGRYFQIGTNEELVSQIDKMSKSKLNGVTPDEMIEDFGADALRLYEMFMGPFDKEKIWNTDAVTGCKRFLNRVYDLVYSDKVSEEENEEALKLTHRLVFAVEKEIEGMQFNTAIAKMMEFLNAFTPLPSYPKTGLKMLVQVLAPFAPHIAEELWEHLGGKESIAFHPFPTVDPSYLEDAMVLYVVQVNGKVRGKWLLPKDKNQEELMAFIQTQPPIAKHLIGPISKVVYVPNKLISIVCDV
jgi:leucyl-tRNA synthetase